MKTIKIKENQEVRKGIIFLVFALLCNLGVSADTFTIGKLKYTTTSSSTVSVGKNGSPTGNIVIPKTVKYNGTQYSVTSIGNYAFCFCTGLTSVTIPSSVTSIGIGNSAFERSGLIEINVDENNTTYSSIDGVLFNKSQTELVLYPVRKQGAYTIPNSVTSIGEYSFYGCRVLTSVTIPNSVESIGNLAFQGCKGLTDIYCHIEVPLTIDSGVFALLVPKNTCTLHVPIGSKEKYEAADVWKEFNIVEDLPTGIVSIDNSQLTIDNDVWYTLNGTRLNGKPTKAGVYIVNGKKVVIK